MMNRRTFLSAAALLAAIPVRPLASLLAEPKERLVVGIDPGAQDRTAITVFYVDDSRPARVLMDPYVPLRDDGGFNAYVFGGCVMLAPTAIKRFGLQRSGKWTDLRGSTFEYWT